MSTNESALVALVEVDETVLEALVKVATTDASANEVTPPLTEGDAWTAARVAWLRDYHRACRAGMDGPKGEATWAVMAAGNVIGAVRLKRTEIDGVLETGIWLARRSRGRGLGTAAAAAVARLASALGAATVRADTTSTNVQALAILKRRGFSVGPTDTSGVVHAHLKTQPSTA